MFLMSSSSFFFLPHYKITRITKLGFRRYVLLTFEPLPLVDGAVKEDFFIIDHDLESIPPATRGQIDADFDE